MSEEKKQKHLPIELNQNDQGTCAMYIIGALFLIAFGVVGYIIDKLGELFGG